jgi:hypothetical protein
VGGCFDGYGNGGTSKQHTPEDISVAPEMSTTIRNLLLDLPLELQHYIFLLASRLRLLESVTGSLTSSDIARITAEYRKRNRSSYVVASTRVYNIDHGLILHTPSDLLRRQWYAAVVNVIAEDVD